MRWVRIIQTIEEQADIYHISWGESFLQVDEEQICGIKIFSSGTSDEIFSIICHAGSYGWQRGLFETLPAIRKEDYDVSGFLTEDEVIEAIQLRKFNKR